MTVRRRFKPDPVPADVGYLSDQGSNCGKEKEAARWAPSSRNQQPWHLVKRVVTDRGVLAEMGRHRHQRSQFLADAPRWQ